MFILCKDLIHNEVFYMSCVLHTVYRVKQEFVLYTFLESNVSSTRKLYDYIHAKAMCLTFFSSVHKNKFLYLKTGTVTILSLGSYGNLIMNVDMFHSGTQQKQMFSVIAYNTLLVTADL